MKRAFTLICLFVTLIMNVYAQDIRKYRVPVYNTIEEYQQNLIGKTFFYIPPIKDGKVVDVNSMGTKSYPVTITSIRGRKKRTKADEMRWKLTSEYSDEHELVIYIGHEDTWWSDEFENTDVPLYDMERYKQDFEKNVKQKLVGQTISHPGSNVSYTVTDVRIGNVNASGHSARNTYVLKNDSTGEIKEIVANDFESIKAIGEVISHPNSKSSYTITNVEMIVDTLGNYIGNTYMLKNNTTGANNNVVANDIEGVKKQLYKNLFVGQYEATLVKVEKPDAPNLRYGKTVVIDKDDAGLTRYGYEDSQINIIMWVSTKEIRFTLKNISDKTQKLVWNDAVFVDMDGTTSKVAHYGTKYSQVEEDQPASVIIKGAKLEDVAYPTNKLKYDDIVMKDWVHYRILPDTYTSDKLPSIRFMLPIQIKDVVNEYTFEFEVNWVHTNPDYKPATK